ncbi:hypothetical protein CRYUN_Cryun02cG0111200 [Craigia yunnanensis]
MASVEVVEGLEGQARRSVDQAWVCTGSAGGSRVSGPNDRRLHGKGGCAVGVVYETEVGGGSNACCSWRELFGVMGEGLCQVEVPCIREVGWGRVSKM